MTPVDTKNQTSASGHPAREKVHIVAVLLHIVTLWQIFLKCTTMEINVNIRTPALAMAVLLGGFTEAVIAHPMSPQSARVSPVLATGPTSPTTPAEEQQFGNRSDAEKAFWGNAQRDGQ